MMFDKCENGHDLTKPGAYLYNSNGNRECRECNPKAQEKRKKISLGTWHSKRSTFG